MKTRVFFVLTAIAFCRSCLAASTPSTQTSSQAFLQYAGPDGTIDYTWTAPPAGSVNSLGTIHIVAKLGGTLYADVTFSPCISGDSPITFQNSQWLLGSSAPVWTLNYRVGANPMQLNITPTLSGRFLSAAMSSPQTLISSIDLGSWPAAANPSPVPVPYYAGNPIYYLAAQGLFATAYYDWTVSSASRLENGIRQVTYAPMTDGGRNPLSERFLLGVSAQINDLFPKVNATPSPYMSQLAGRTIFDIWAGPFEEVATSLRRLASYNVTNCAIILHNWQLGGYDNELPSHFPANPILGGETLSDVSAAARSLGCLFALHENYVDYYPNSPLFNEASVALDSTRNRLLSWFQPLTQIQSFATKPTQMVSQAKLQSPSIHSFYGTTASYIDVVSAVAPWWRADMDSSVRGAGKFATFADAGRDLWKYERSTHEGPVFGEGCNHFYWAGQIDGAEAQFGAGNIPLNSGSQVPLFVDFDLQSIHPYQVDQGMGSYERWLAPGTDIHQTVTLDAYRMQEIAFGHAPWLGSDLWSNPARVLVEQNLVGPIAKRYGPSSAKSIQYFVKGHWTDSSNAARSSSWNRVQIKYSNGDTVIANGAADTFVTNGISIPQYGWLATGNNLLAFTGIKDNTIVDYLDAGSFLFANSRNQNDLASADQIAQPGSAALVESSSNSITLRLKWHVFDFLQLQNYRFFVHFVDPAQTTMEGIAFQCDHDIPFDYSDWKPGASLTETFSCAIPTELYKANYSVRVGIFSAITGSRVVLGGLDDSSSRIIIGNLFTNPAHGVSFSPATAQAASPSPDMRMNSTGRVIDFGAVKTDGMVNIALDESGKWIIRTYPLYRDVVVQFAQSRIPQPSSAASVMCDSAVGPVSIAPAAPGYWQIHTGGAKSCTW